ncbi:clavesin-2-like isoform X1 [Aphis gossypii]|uniref:clavesin-2-like isoform X1 n=1 Tax=Aphis gossypii TaxID=80765 RepID=UPI00215908EE|nr:clavesin-2-like isoform X1 [Aphis gossypii]XP_027847994.2 clavesin-2-like isoform X1 [Aphis gossypii]XP_027847995.2 clavesin-2-like isoform X1 [Aphis gossypii]
MAEYAEYRQNNLDNILNFNYGIELFPGSSQNPVIKKNTREVALIKLKRLLRSNGFAFLAETNKEAFILMFLYARKMNENNALDLIRNYYQFRKEHDLWFRRLEPFDPKIQMAIQDGFPSVLSNLDRRSRRVLFMVCSQWNTERYCLLTIYRALLVSLEHLIKDVNTQYNGFVFIVDWTNFTARQTMNISPRLLHVMLQGLQDCFPAKIKAVHFINQPWYIDGLMSVVKPFLKEKTKNKIILHGLNLNTLHKHFPRDILPSELGGEQPPYDSRIWLKSLLGSSLGVDL